MSRLSRFTQKIFGSSAGANEIAQFGSLEAGSPAFTTNVGVIQALSQYLSGWFGATSGNSPAIEDMNALFYLITYQLAYLMQSGVPEWDAGTTYFTGNIVNYNGDLYSSIVDDNDNNVPTDVAAWKSLSADIISAKFTLEDASVPYVNISGPHYQSSARTLSQVAITMLNSGLSGSTVVQINVYRAGALNATATASIASAAGAPATAVADLSASLSLFEGDILTCDVVSTATGAPESLSVEYFGGDGVGGGGGGGGGGGPAPYVYTITGADITNKGLTLAYTPTDSARILIDLQGGSRQFPGLDYSVGSPDPDDFLSWDGLGLESIIQSGDKVLITYSG